jgi:hypothetical protein
MSSHHQKPTFDYLWMNRVASLDANVDLSSHRLEPTPPNDATTPTTPSTATNILADDAALSEQTSELERNLFPEAARVDYNLSLTDLSESVTSVISITAVKLRAGATGRVSSNSLR